MKNIIVKLLNRLVASGHLIKDTRPLLVKSYATEAIRYKSDYERVVDGALVNLDYFRYLDRSYEFQLQLFRADDCFVDNISGGVLIKRKIVKESLLNTLGYIMRAGIYKKLMLLPRYRAAAKRVSKGFLLTGLMSGNFYHFLIDSLPRIVPYLELVKQDPEIRLIVNHPKKFTHAYLRLLGVDETNCIFAESDLLVDQLYFSTPAYALSDPSSIFPNFIYSKSVFRQFADSVSERAAKALPDFAGHERIYITRKDVSRRVLLNEDEVYQALRKMGFVFIALSDINVVQQVILMRQARVIVTVHGAGLANLIYARNSVVVEIFPFNKKLSTLYQMHQLAQINNNRHILFVARDATSEQDVSVDPASLCQVIRESIDAI